MSVKKRVNLKFHKKKIFARRSNPKKYETSLAENHDRSSSHKFPLQLPKKCCNVESCCSSSRITYLRNRQFISVLPEQVQNIIHIFRTACKLGLSTLIILYRHLLFSHPETMPKQTFEKCLPCPLVPRKFDNGKLSQRVTSTLLVKTDLLLCKAVQLLAQSSLFFFWHYQRGVEKHFEPFK